MDTLQNYDNLNNAYKNNHVLMGAYIGTKQLYKTHIWTNPDTDVALLGKIDVDETPTGIYVDSQDNIIVSTAKNVRKYNSDGDILWKYKGSESIKVLHINSNDDIYIGNVGGYIRKIRGSDGVGAYGGLVYTSSSVKDFCFLDGDSKLVATTDYGVHLMSDNGSSLVKESLLTSNSHYTNVCYNNGHLYLIYSSGSDYYLKSYTFKGTETTLPTQDWSYSPGWSVESMLVDRQTGDIILGLLIGRSKIEIIEPIEGKKVAYSSEANNYMAGITQDNVGNIYLFNNTQSIIKYNKFLSYKLWSFQQSGTAYSNVYNSLAVDSHYIVYVMNTDSDKTTNSIVKLQQKEI